MARHEQLSVGELIDGDGKKVLGKQQTAIADLVHTVGTADGTVADVGAAFNQTTLNDNFKELTAKYNALLAKLRTHGIIAT